MRTCQKLLHSSLQVKQVTSRPANTSHSPTLHDYLQRVPCAATIPATAQGLPPTKLLFLPSDSNQSAVAIVADKKRQKCENARQILTSFAPRRPAVDPSVLRGSGGRPGTVRQMAVEVDKAAVHLPVSGGSAVSNWYLRLDLSQPPGESSCQAR